MQKATFLYLIIGVVLTLSFSCSEEKEYTLPAILPQDSASVMTTYGVNTLISDSGVVKYRIVSECWEINQVRQPSRWIFVKGLFLEQFDEKFHVQSYIQCDTAYYYDHQRLWELRGRVSIRTKDGLFFTSEELFWDQAAHELYSNKYSNLVTPERQLQGAYFRSDEKMTRYMVSDTKGAFNVENFDGTRSEPPMGTDSVVEVQRAPIVPQKKNLTQP